MKLSEINEWLQVIATLALIVSIIFLAQQVRQADINSDRENSLDFFDGGMALTEQINGNIDAWQKGCLGEQLTPRERGVFTNLVRQVFLRNLNSWTLDEQRSYGAAGSDFNVERLARTVAAYPGFAEALANAFNLFADKDDSFALEGSLVLSFYEIVRARAEELKSMGFGDGHGPEYCGY